MKRINASNFSNLSFGAAVLILFVVGIVATNNLRALIQDNEQVNRTLIVLTELDEALALITSAETGQRGYIITGDESYLEPYHAALSNQDGIHQHLQDLRDLTRDNPDQQRNLAALEPLIQARLAIMQNNLDLRSELGFDAAQEAVASGEGKEAMDDIRRILADMKAEENELLRERSDAASASLERTIRSLAAGAVLAFSLLIFSFYATSREISLRRRSERSLQQLNLELDERVRQRTAELADLSRRNELILASAGEGIYGLDLDGRITFINAAGAAMLGQRPEDLIGAVGHDNHHHTRADGTPYPREECPIYAALKDGEIYRVDYEVFWKKDGSSFPVEYVSSPIREAGQLQGAVVVFTDIAARQQAEQAALENEARYHHILDAMMEGCQIIGFDWRYIYVNEIVAAQGRRTREELTNHTMMEMYPGIEQTELFAILRQCMEERVARRLENQFVFPNGSIGYFELSIQPAREGIFILSTDITERKQAELRVQQLARLYATLSQVNQAIVRATHREELFDVICKVAVEFGKFGLAWIGLIDRETGAVAPGAVYGVAQNQLPFQTINYKEAPFRDGLIGQGIATGGLVHSRDIQTDPTMQHWRAMAESADFHAAAALPFRQGGEIVGFLKLYATEVDFFEDEDQQSLLKEMALDISFALDGMEREQKRQQAEARLEHSEKLLRQVIDLVPPFIFAKDVEGRFLLVNQAVADAYGTTVQELTGKTDADFSSSEEEVRNFRKMDMQVIQSGKSLLIPEEQITDARGQVRLLQTTKIPFKFSESQPGVLGVSVDITERRQAEAERERLLSTLEASLNELYMFDPQTLKFEYVNQSALRNLGYSMVQMRTLTPLDLKPDFTEASFRQMIEPLLQDEKEVLIFETRHRRADASLYPVEVHLQLVQRAGSPVFLAVILDITARWLAEAALRLSEARFSNAFEFAAIGIALVAPDGRFMQVNRALCELVGYEADELLSKTFQDITHPDDLETDLSYVHQLLAGERETYQMEKRYFHRQGQIVWVLLSVSLVRDGEGHPLFYISQIQNITAGKQAEENLRRQNRRLKALREIDTAILAADSMESIVGAALSHIRDLIDCQRAHLTLIDSESREAVIFETNTAGQTSIPRGSRLPLAAIEDIIQPLLQNQPLLLDDLRALAASRPEFQRLLENGLRSLCSLPLFSQGKLMGMFSLYSASPGFFDEEKVNLGREVANQVAIAITQNNLLQALREFNAELEQRVEERTTQYLQVKQEAEQANRAKSEFLSRMSHELRTPLNAILGFAQLLEMDPLTEAQQRGVQHTLKAGRHLLDLINEVLDLARIEAGRLAISPEPVLVRAVVAESFDLVQQAASAQNITLELAESALFDAFVFADWRRLKQILLNLLSNAVKYNRPGGSVTVHLSRVEGGKRPACRISVTDAGPGIAPGHLTRLFQPFDRLDADETGTEGTGLGLTVAQKLVNAMNGTIGVDSEVGRGSTFWFELPLTESPLARTARLRALTEAIMTIEEITGTLLYVEDNISNLELVQAIMERRPGVQLFTALQGGQALELAREVKPDLILLDLHLSDMHGADVLRRLRADEQTRDIPIIILSADATESQKIRLKDEGAHSYITKPLDVRKFLEAVDAALQWQ